MNAAILLAGCIMFPSIPRRKAGRFSWLVCWSAAMRRFRATMTNTDTVDVDACRGDQIRELAKAGADIVVHIANPSPEAAEGVCLHPASVDRMPLDAPLGLRLHRILLTRLPSDGPIACPYQSLAMSAVNRSR